MRHLSFGEVVALHERVVGRTGGKAGVKEPGLVDSAVAQPRMTFGGDDLYPTVVEKSAALGFSLLKNHGFVDGNKRIGHAAMEAFLALNGHEIAAGVDEQEAVILEVAAGAMPRDTFTDWLRARVVPLAAAGRQEGSHRDHGTDRRA